MTSSSTELATIAGSGRPLRERAPALLHRLGRVLPFDGAWLAVADPGGPGWSCVAGTGLDDGVPPSPSDLPYPEVGARLRQLAPIPAPGSDPLRTVAAAASLVRGATAATVLHRGTGVGPLPGLADDVLLAPDSPVVAVARSRIDEGQVYATYLWPRGCSHAPDGHVRVTVLTCPDGAPVGVLGTVVLSPPGELHGLTPRELVVLGLVVDGCTNQEIARTLVVAPRTVATHLEHVLVKLDAPTRTLAAVRAEREGLLVPSFPSPCRC